MSEKLLDADVAEMPIDELRKAYANALTDWAETDTYVKNAVSGLLTEEEINGDGYAFQSVEDIVDILVAKLQAR